MKKSYLFSLAILIWCSFSNLQGQEILADVTVNSQQIAGSNNQVFRQLEKNLRDFINNTSWTGRRLQNFEKIKSNFSFIISERNGNRYKGTLVVQSVRPVYNSTYESPMLNINDTGIDFEYIENENLIFNERQFSGKNLIDIISFYCFVIIGTDADSFQNMGGKEAFDTALKIANNSQNQGYGGWLLTEGNRTRAALINNILAANAVNFRQTNYQYHRNGLDILYKTADELTAKTNIKNALMQLQVYENNYQLNYPLNIFIDTKADEIYQIFSTGNSTTLRLNDLKELMSLLSPKNINGKWSKWK